MNYRSEKKEGGGLSVQAYGERTDLQSVTDLEFVMTNSAFGYEYAISALDKEGEWGFGSDKIKQEVDGYKKAYFEARRKLKRLDERRLTKLEQDLTMQKMMVFSRQKYLH
ncbi:MAG: hypothetical protein HQM16_19625 [Deltaproteobacteria bacterium]|nr:hypothetical protein [Deltaproteobacteria bacterium]